MARHLTIAILGLAFSASVAKPQGPSPAIVVKANYIHADYRCVSCLKIERWSSIAIQGGLADSMKTGRLAWGTQSMDAPEGSALADKMGLTTKSLVLMEMRNDKMTRFKVLPDTWKHLRDSVAFSNYVKTETVAFLKTAR
jgi:hypothetical protein